MKIFHCELVVLCNEMGLYLLRNLKFPNSHGHDRQGIVNGTPYGERK